MDQNTMTDLFLSAVFWPAVVLSTHRFYVRKWCHPEWVPWKAAARFLWDIAWPFLLALVGVVILIYGLGKEPGSDTADILSRMMAPIIVTAVMIPAFRRARRVI